MNWFLFHVASGGVFFTGTACVALAALLGVWTSSRLRRIAVIVGIVGLIGVAISSTPLPWWYYAVGTLVSVAWLAVAARTAKRPRLSRVVSAVFAATWIAGAAAELPHHFTPTLSPTRERLVTVFGDSVTAGVGDEQTETWPKIVTRLYGIEVHDRSEMGATVSSVLKQAHQVPISGSVVILEIGGNDVLGFTSVRDFERDLDTLLRLLTGKNRQIVMFELPLPPFCNSYGRAQRVLAARYGAVLIPKRVLMKVFATDEATLDSIHLSQTGHRLMATEVWRILEPAFR